MQKLKSHMTLKKASEYKSLLEEEEYGGKTTQGLSKSHMETYCRLFPIYMGGVK